MSTFYRYLVVFFTLAHFLTACNAQAVRAQQVAPGLQRYGNMLGKPADDKAVADLITANRCAGANQFQLCQDAGLALWLDSSGIVRKIYLYLNNAEGFVPYQGELPFGLKFYDTMGAVEYKLDRQGIGNAGRSEDVAAPDHMHYWAVYREAGLTIIYNSPFADEDATIYAIVLNS